MKNFSKKSFLVLFSILSASAALAQHGILPGEPDPNSGPGKDSEKVETDGAIIDRRNCPKGQLRFHEMKCGTKNDAPKCENFSPVLKCYAKKPAPLRCKKPLKPVPLYRCE